MFIHGPSIGIGSGITIVTILVMLLVFNDGIQIDSDVLIEEELPKKQQSDLFFDNASPFLGDKNAPITLVEFGDYQCHFCNQYYHNTEHE